MRSFTNFKNGQSILQVMNIFYVILLYLFSIKKINFDFMNKLF